MFSLIHLSLFMCTSQTKRGASQTGLELMNQYIVCMNSGTSKEPWLTTHWETDDYFQRRDNALIVQHHHWYL